MIINQLTLTGNLTAEPELRFTPNGAAVATLTIASTKRRFNKQTQEWEDGNTLFLPVEIWNEAAELAAETMTKGTRVIASGELVQESWEKDGQKRTRVKLRAEYLGPILHKKKEAKFGTFTPPATQQGPFQSNTPQQEIPF